MALTPSVLSATIGALSRPPRHGARGVVTGRAPGRLDLVPQGARRDIYVAPTDGTATDGGTAHQQPGTDGDAGRHSRWSPGHPIRHRSSSPRIAAAMSMPSSSALDVRRRDGGADRLSPPFFARGELSADGRYLVFAASLQHPVTGGAIEGGNCVVIRQDLAGRRARRLGVRSRRSRTRFPPAPRQDRHAGSSDTPRPDPRPPVRRSGSSTWTARAIARSSISVLRSRRAPAGSPTVGAPSSSLRRERTSRLGIYDTAERDFVWLIDDPSRAVSGRLSRIAAAASSSPRCARRAAAPSCSTPRTATETPIAAALWHAAARRAARRRLARPALRRDPTGRALVRFELLVQDRAQRCACAWCWLPTAP